MKSFDSVTHQGFILPDPKNRLFLWSVFLVVSLISGAYFVGNAFFAKEYKQRLARWGLIHTMPDSKFNSCKRQCLPFGSEALPEGIIARTSNLEMRPLWDSGKDNAYKSSFPLDCLSCDQGILKRPLNLLAMAVGLEQKEIVNKIVEKFLSSDFVVMLFHYDGFVDGWKSLAWSSRAIHVSAINQTKWWFAKRFLHPDIVVEYNYIFLWDEDLLVDNFDPKRYLSIVKEEGLEISQPALDPTKSEVHHPLTVHKAGSKVHRRYYKLKGSGRCDDKSTAPPCIGWVEMMAPVFSKKSWQCVWHLIQNDLIHAWGLDRQLGYCAQGDRMQNVGVVDSEYIVHLGLPTLGGSNGNEAPSGSSGDNRAKVRMQSYIEMQVFGKRWKDAAEKDKCWIDPYEKANKTGH
ncbi:hypothetical protein GLYMA_16G001100v4 [Glycine max]|uniref:Uncharacterized protein n=2 Tax=Glycine max TaxID=3847 RepID=A0A0R0FJ17_SOYBN|nr:uncharacterized protein LOC100797710 isoform X1 [Glycine max]XP_028205765.1 uncharacterized protein LOC114389325 isoform X1 [Glycine soja]KAH1149201.1 hypothetical protein GYH30_043684 [Glycine max]KRH06038.1 hypothetical protein GLYMA_16G001100v4 [Glycine max]|eukprot:XP_006598788.1 uncharacterized protein LOC100797710 isoform X1 [Glycine max]